MAYEGVQTTGVILYIHDRFDAVIALEPILTLIEIIRIAAVNRYAVNDHNAASDVLSIGGKPRSVDAVDHPTLSVHMIVHRLCGPYVDRSIRLRVGDESLISWALELAKRTQRIDISRGMARHTKAIDGTITQSLLPIFRMEWV